MRRCRRVGPTSSSRNILDMHVLRCRKPGTESTCGLQTGGQAHTHSLMPACSTRPVAAALLTPPAACPGTGVCGVKRRTGQARSMHNLATPATSVHTPKRRAANPLYLQISTYLSSCLGGGGRVRCALHNGGCSRAGLARQLRPLQAERGQVSSMLCGARLGQEC